MVTSPAAFPHGLPPNKAQVAAAGELWTPQLSPGPVVPLCLCTSCSFCLKCLSPILYQYLFKEQWTCHLWEGSFTFPSAPDACSAVPASMAALTHHIVTKECPKGFSNWTLRSLQMGAASYSPAASNGHLTLTCPRSELLIPPMAPPTPPAPP